MDSSALQQLLDEVRTGASSPDDAARRLRRLPFADLGFAKVDHHRPLRQGLPEAVYGQGKSPEQCAAIVGELLRGADGEDGHDGGSERPFEKATLESCTHDSTACAEHRTGATDHLPDGADDGAVNGIPGSPGIPGSTGIPGSPGSPVILTRADHLQVEAAMMANPGGTRTLTGLATGSDRVRGELSTVVWRPAPERRVNTLIVTAGTADLPVARECQATLEALGVSPTLLTDCGVAGIHRLLVSIDELSDADAVVVVAGMEGALASLVGGITPAPVVAVPTSTGYGAGLEGVTALLAMHASCAAGVAVIGIDNGFGAACAVSRIASAGARSRASSSGSRTPDARSQ